MPCSVYRRAGITGTTTFVVAFATTVFVVATDWYGPPISEREEIARYGVLACRVLIGTCSACWLRGGSCDCGRPEIDQAAYREHAALR